MALDLRSAPRVPFFRLVADEPVAWCLGAPDRATLALAARLELEVEQLEAADLGGRGALVLGALPEGGFAIARGALPEGVLAEGADLEAHAAQPALRRALRESFE